MEHKVFELTSLQSNYSNLLEEIRSLEMTNERLRRGEESSVVANLKVIEAEHQSIIEKMKRFVIFPPLCV